VNEDDYQQARDLWNIFLEKKEDEIFINNLSGNLSKALPEVQKETVKMFAKVEKVIGDRIEKKLGELAKEGQGPDHVKAPYGLREAYGAGY
jgi:catalase